jgi:hypothetical protein
MRHICKTCDCRITSLKCLAGDEGSKFTIILGNSSYAVDRLVVARFDPFLSPSVQRNFIDIYPQWQCETPRQCFYISPTYTACEDDRDAYPGSRTSSILQLCPCGRTSTSFPVPPSTNSAPLSLPSTDTSDGRLRSTLFHPCLSASHGKFERLESQP